MVKHEKFSNRLSAVLVAAGCSVGLGNIWRFPYVVGENGGGAFLLVYLLAVVVIGLPVMISEFAIGRSTGVGAVPSFRQLGGNRWKLLGYNSVVTSALILGFYYVVAGWTASTLCFRSQENLLNTRRQVSIRIYLSATADPWKPILFTWVFIALNHFIIQRG